MTTVRDGGLRRSAPSRTVPRCSRRRPRSPVVSKAPAAVNPSGIARRASATPSARRSGVVAAVASSNAVMRPATGARGARPGNMRVGRDDARPSPARSRPPGARPRARSRSSRRRRSGPSRPRGRGGPCPRATCSGGSTLEAKRVSPPHSCRKRTSTPSAPGSSSAAFATRRTSSGPIDARHQPRTPSCTSRNRAGDAPWPTRATCPGWPLPQFGVPHRVQSSRPPDRVARAPELGRDPRVVGVAVHLDQPAVLDPPGDLAAELEVDALVVDRPGRVRRHEHPVVGVADDVGERALARLDRDVRHPDQREVLPAVRAHRARRS